jgi:hypothetical protein
LRGEGKGNHGPHRKDGEAEKCESAGHS